MATRYERIYKDINENLKDICEAYYTDNMSSAFGHFILKLKFGITDEEAFECMTDGSNDNGIDAIFLENDKTAHFFQFKFPSAERGINNGVTEGEVLKIGNGFKSFVSSDDEFNSISWNQLLIDKREEYSKLDIYDFKLWIVRFTNQDVNGQISGIMDSILSMYKQQTGNNISCAYLLADECVNLYENNIKNIWPDFKIRYKKTLSPFSDEKSNINSAFITLKSIYETFKDIEEKIYEGNVRYLNPNSKINDGISNTILKNYVNFHLLNNGITIVCSSCNDNTAQGYLDVTGGTIINGAQTVGTIINTLDKMSEDERIKYEESFVFAKIISLNEDTQIVSDMVYTLNTQNQMKSSYTISNDLIVKGVQEKINKETEFFLEIKNNEFSFEKEKDGNFSKLTKNKIDIETFIQIYTAFYNIDNLASLAKNSKAQLFNSDNIQKIINELKYDEALFSYKTYLKLMDIIKDYRAYRKNKEKNEILEILDITEEEISEYRYLNTGNIIIMFALGVVYSKYEIDPEKNMIRVIKILKDIFKNEQNISNATKIKESFDAVEKKLDEFIKSDRKGSSKYFVI